MGSPLENLSGPGKALAAEPPDANEFAGLQPAKAAKAGAAQGVRPPSLAFRPCESANLGL